MNILVGSKLSQRQRCKAAGTVCSIAKQRARLSKQASLIRALLAAIKHQVEHPPKAQVYRAYTALFRTALGLLPLAAGTSYQPATCIMINIKGRI